MFISFEILPSYGSIEFRKKLSESPDHYPLLYIVLSVECSFPRLQNICFIEHENRTQKYFFFFLIYRKNEIIFSDP